MKVLKRDDTGMFDALYPKGDDHEFLADNVIEDTEGLPDDSDDLLADLVSPQDHTAPRRKTWAKNADGNSMKRCTAKYNQ